jgi:hypothetical protein
VEHRAGWDARSPHRSLYQLPHWWAAMTGCELPTGRVCERHCQNWSGIRKPA